MFATSVQSKLIARAAGALMLAAVTAPALAPLAGAEEVNADFAPGQGGSVDYDGDGLSQDLELYYGLDPYNRDSDYDGLLDGDEFYDRYGYSDPLDADTDNDRLSDGEEVYGLYGYRTDPYRWDTDGDGYSDWDEIYYGRNPVVAGI